MNLSLQFIQHTGPHLAFKFGFLTIVLLVIIFLLVVLKQIYSMNHIVTQKDLFPYLIIFSLSLIAATIVLFVAGLVIL